MVKIGLDVFFVPLHEIGNSTIFTPSNLSRLYDILLQSFHYRKILKIKVRLEPRLLSV